MHPYSPHSPARLQEADPLTELAAELVRSPYARKPGVAHAAADELALRRPRRPASRRAGYRTPPLTR